MHKYVTKTNLKKGVAAAVLSAFIALVAMVSPLIAAAATLGQGAVIVIDAGHGGEDAGVRGVRTGVKESDLNLQVAMLVGEYLMADGFKVVYTRTNDTMRSHPSVRNNKKRADMFCRGDIINSVKPDAVVSIHMNFYSSPSRSGAQVFFSRKEERGRTLATSVQNSLNESINTGRQYAPLSAEKYILSCSSSPSVIVECGFLSSPLDEAKLILPDYRAEVAMAIFLGIKNYFYPISA